MLLMRGKCTAVSRALLLGGNATKRIRRGVALWIPVKQAGRTGMNTKLIVAATALCVVVAGCGGTAMSPSKLASSEASVRGAEVAGAHEVPSAALQLKLAQDEIEKAKTLSAHGEGEAADRMLERAETDAQLAHTLAKEEAAKKAAEAVMDQVKQAQGEAQ